MDLDEKFNLLLVEMKNICNKIDERFEQMETRLDEMDKNISNIKTNNQYEHGRIYNMVNCLNSAFLKFETEQKSNIDFLLAESEDCRNHQNIYGHEFHKVNDLVAQNSFRISNLEKHFN